MIEITSENKLNLETLEKGDFISEDVLRAITGYDPRENHERYQFAVLKIRGMLRRQRRLFTRGEGNSIRILTTNEASYYKTNRARIHIAAQERDYEDLLSLDENEMDAFTRQTYRKNVDEIGRFVAAHKEAKRVIKTEQRREREAYTHQEKPVKYISMKEEKDGTANNHGETGGNETADPSQRTDGESAVQNRQGDEGTNQ